MHQDCQPIQICVEDTLVWNPTTNGCFSCKSAMRYRSAEVNWNKLVWDTAIIPKCGSPCLLVPHTLPSI